MLGGKFLERSIIKGWNILLNDTMETLSDGSDNAKDIGVIVKLDVFLFAYNERIFS